jgi:threonine/homoserine/homoserine lactone efflux protein
MTALEIAIAALPFSYFMFVASVTPGPNNLMLAASGMNYGIRRTIPHMCGVAFGFFFLMLLCTFGVGAAYHAVPQLRIVMNVLAALYLAYLAWRIAMAGQVSIDEKSGARPMTFLEASLFQFVNPKAWVMALAATSGLMPDVSIFAQVMILVAMAFLINFPCIGIWTFFGRAMAAIFKSDRARKIINIVLALALVATIPMMML